MSLDTQLSNSELVYKFWVLSEKYQLPLSPPVISSIYEVIALVARYYPMQE